MAISPPGDLVLDVMRAADPQRSRLAAARLQEMAAPAKASPVAAAAGVADAVAGQWRQTMKDVASSGAAAKEGGPLRLGRAPDAQVLRPDGSLKGSPANSLAEGVAAKGTPLREAAPESALRQAYAGLEGVLIANMLDGMMGSGRGGLFGGGLAGGYWKSLLAQTIAEAVAQGGGLGVADALLPRDVARRAGA